MARNEEKQLARLNRVHLQKLKEEDLRKRPPRPKLETLTTAKEVTKWLPSITRDIEFYVKQMEVPCYHDSQIEEFTRRIHHLKGEYKAFLRKLRQLNPENKITPWTDRPYALKRQKVSQVDITATEDEESSNPNQSEEESSRVNDVNFTPISTPVLNDDEQYKYNFGYEKPQTAACPDLMEESMNQPLQFATNHLALTADDECVDKDSKCCDNRSSLQRLAEQNRERSTSSSTNQNLESSKSDVPTNACVTNAASVLNLPYSDSSSSDDDT